MALFALVDCNNFYASCERVFNPSLNGKPIVILSNNDGCVIARSNEAKALGIPMGAPFFKWDKFCKAQKVHVFSSNYELYGDMSARVMTSLAECWPDLEIYSIDEAFLELSKLPTADLESFILDLRKKIIAWTGIPVSIGVGPTKTLAKVANLLAKTEGGGIFNLCDPEIREQALAALPVGKIWGIGRALTEKLQGFGLMTAKDLRDADAKLVRSTTSVVVEKTIEELRGSSCIGLELIQPRKQIISSRSFGKVVTDLEQLEEAVSHYAAKACAKLRHQKSTAQAISVFLQTSRFVEGAGHFAKTITVPFAAPTQDTGYIIHMAKLGLKRLYRKNFAYNKAGIILIDLQSEAVQQQDFLTKQQTQKQVALMKTLDEINQRMGRYTMFNCSEGIQKTWQVRCDKRSGRYTTRWLELARVKMEKD